MPYMPASFAKIIRYVKMKEIYFPIYSVHDDGNETTKAIDTLNIAFDPFRTGWPIFSEPTRIL